MTIVLRNRLPAEIVLLPNLNSFKREVSKMSQGRFGPGSIRPELFRPILGVGRCGFGRWSFRSYFLGESIQP